jgi:trehalose synthase
VHSVEGAAFRLRHLLNNPELIARMGAAGREHVRRSFLVTRHLTDYMALLIHLTR